MEKQLARLRGFHLVWRHGALEPAGLASAPRDPQAREQWIGSAMVTWLVSSVEGRSVVEHMQHLPRGMVVTIESGGNWSIETDLAGRTEGTSAATGLAASMWLAGTPQGQRVFRRIKERARRRANAQPAPPAPTPPPVTTPQPAPAPTPPDTTTQPAPAPEPPDTTTQPQPPPGTTTGSAPAPALPG